jgi:tripartite-type tricarboxylate transporter receptor subunit TctC
LKPLTLLVCAVLVSGVALPQGALSQPYPSRPLRIIVPFAPGGSADLLTRIMGQHMTESLGQAVITDNRPAAGGIAGTDLVAKAPPDGHTLLLGTIAGMAIAPALFSKVPYEPLNDFAHVSLWVTFPLVMIVPAASTIKDLKGFIAEARAKPGALRFGAQGLGSSSHIFAEWMNSLAGVKVSIVPYKGGGPALTGLLAGEVDYSMIAVSTAKAQVATGRIRALGVSSAKPTPNMPGVPSIASVLPGYDALNFHGLHVPLKTPAAMVARLNSESSLILKRADMAERLNGFAMDIVAGTPDEYRAFVKAQITQWAPVVKASGARVD